MLSVGLNSVRSMSPAIGRGFAAGVGVGVVDAEGPPPQAKDVTANAMTATRRCRPRGVSFVIPFWVIEALVPMTAIESHAVPTAGQLAPDFTLPSTSGEKLTLSSLRGKPVLLAFFPLAFSGTCTAELCEMRDDHDEFARRGVTVLPISVDHTYSLKEYKAKYSMKVDMLSDFRRDVSRLYGVMLEDRFYSKRAYFLIAADGVIRWEHVEENPSERRADAELLAAIDRM